MMRSSLLVFGIVATTAAGAQNSPGPVALHLSNGSQATLSADQSDKAHLISGTAEPISAGEIEMLRELVRNHPEAFGPNSAPVQTDQRVPPIQPNRIRFRFLPFDDGKQTLLIIENGALRSFMYKARIGRGSRSIPTDVCQLVPLKRNIEHWPYPLDWIEVSEVRAVAYNESAPPRCE